MKDLFKGIELNLVSQGLHKTTSPRKGFQDFKLLWK